LGDQAGALGVIKHGGMLVDGNTAASHSKLDLGTQGLTWFAVDEEYAPRGQGYAGHFYIDTVTASLSTTSPLH
jgi:hypothetical protein